MRLAPLARSEGNPLNLEELQTLQGLGQATVEAAQQMERIGLVEGTAGNISCIDESRHVVLITPTGVSYGELDVTKLAVVDLDGNLLSGRYRPSSELEMHLAVYRSRNDVRSVVHTHSRFATTFAVLNRPVVAVHYILAFAGSRVEVAPYRTYGTKELGERCVETLAGRNAVLLQNHGVIAVGTSAQAALNVARAVEYTAELQWRAESLGAPGVLDDEEMERVAVEIRRLRPAPSRRERRRAESRFALSPRRQRPPELRAEGVVAPEAAETRGHRVLLAAGLLLVSLNLRPSMSALSPVLGAIRRSTGLSAAGAGLLTTLPLVCFGLLAPVAPRLARRRGTGEVLLGCLLVLFAGIVVRSTGYFGLFLGTLLIGVSVAVANVLMPGIVKRDFPAK